MASPITSWTFLVRCHFLKKWELTDIAQFLTASVRIGRISNIPLEINFRSNFRWDSYIDARQYLGRFLSKNTFEVWKPQSHAGLDCVLRYCKNILGLPKYAIFAVTSIYSRLMSFPSFFLVYGAKNIYFLCKIWKSTFRQHLLPKCCF